MPDHSEESYRKLLLSAEQRATLAEERLKATEQRAQAAEKRLEQAVRHGWGLLTDLMSLDEIISRAMKKAERG